MSKYLKKKFVIFFPNLCIKKATRKNLIPLPNNDATAKAIKFILKNPAEIVNSLYGIGVKAETNIARNALSENFCAIKAT